MPLGSKPCWRETGNLVTVQPDPAQAKPCLHVSPLQNGMLQLTLGPVAFILFSMMNTCGETVTNPLILIFLLLESCGFSE